jgi:hypothetical protein
MTMLTIVERQEVSSLPVLYVLGEGPPIFQ